MKKHVLYLTACLFTIFNALNATTIQSNQTGNWNTTSTWVNNIVPTNDDDVIIAIGHDVTIDDIVGGSSSCKSLTVNGKLIYNSQANFSIGNYSSRSSAFLVNGTFEYSMGYSFKVYGYLKFGTGSTFNMTSGGMIIDGTLTAGTSVAAGQALLDVTDIGTLNAINSTIGIRNPHFDAATPCIKGAKYFGNTIAFGSGNIPDVNNDFILSETNKPHFNFVEINIAGNQSRFKATNIVIDGAVSIISGTFYNYSTTTPIYVKGDLNVNPGVTINGNIEFNGTAQQNINPQYLSGATHITFNGDIVVNNPTEVKSKINVTIQGGDLKFILGNFDTEQKTLTLERTPVNASSSSYVITHNVYQNKGFLMIKNLTGNTIFPVGKFNSYDPVWINAPSGDYKISVTPLVSSPSVPSSSEVVDLTWDIQRVSGASNADITVQWNTANEMGSFSTIRNQCRIYQNNTTIWDAISPTGSVTTIGTVHTKTMTGVNTFAPIAIFSSAVLPVEISRWTGKKQGNNVQLNWTTAYEKNNRGFEIQKNTEGSLDFETIGYIKSQDNGQAFTDYVFWDKAFTKTAYYRLKQVDLDGKEMYSKVISIEADAKNSDIVLFPNPILRGQVLNIQLDNNNDSDNFDITIFNTSGQQILHQKGIASIETNTWTKGIYFVKIVKDTTVTTLKVMKSE